MKNERSKVYIENLGCAKNQVDAEVMLEALCETGKWQYCPDSADADLIIINTCGFIEPAREESLNTLFELRNNYPDKRIIMAGCLSERYGKEISTELVEADGFFGNLDLPRVTEIAEKVMKGERGELYPELSQREFYRREQLFSFPGSAYLKLSEGCSHHCRYCAIPIIRGELRSRPESDILDDARHLVASGIREINLIAQDLAAYGTDFPAETETETEDATEAETRVQMKIKGKSMFLGLLEKLSAIEGDFRIRMLYIHPDDFPAALPAFILDNPKVLPYFDIPFQHSSAPVLRGMGRTGSAESYLKLVNSIRETLPDAVIRSTFMLGFPGERKQHIREMETFIRKAELDWAGFFIYSPEEGTPAYKLRTPASHRRAAGRVEEVKTRLETLQNQISEERLQRWVGREVDVLIEENIENEDLIIGRMFAQAPEVDGSTVVLSCTGKPGDVIRCGIRRAVGIDLEAVPVS